jgi:hypothetical protein
MAQKANGLNCCLLTVRIDHPSLPPGPIQGYRFFWAFYVTGYDPTRHCQPCFLGTPSTQINPANARSGRDYQMDERKTFPYLYICGFAAGPKALRGERNFHLALKPEEGAGASGVTYNGYTVSVTSAVSLSIPELPAGWNGLPSEHTRCKNFRFAVATFGYPETSIVP